MPHQSRASIPVRLRPRREIGCLRAGRQQPVIELEPAEHPLAIEQQRGTAFERLLDLDARHGHDFEDAQSALRASFVG